MEAAENVTFSTTPAEFSDPEYQDPVSWYNVGEAWCFILISVAVSYGMGTHMEIAIIVSSLRCLVQLTLMGLVLDSVLRSENIFFVMLMTWILVLLGAYELAYIRAKNAIRNLFIIALTILLISNVSIAILGTALSLQEKPFWAPSKFIPVLGMLLGKSMSTIAMATHQCLDSINLHGPILEAKLAMGATRYEVVKPFAIEVIRLSMLPVITQLSVMGLVSIPGTMTGQLMTGSTVTDAVIYQQCIMLMITASSGLGVVMVVMMYMLTIVNRRHTLCWDEIVERKSLVDFTKVRETLRSVVSSFRCIFLRRKRLRAGQKSVKHRYEQVEQVEMHHVPSEKELYDLEVVMPTKPHESIKAG